MSTTFRGVFSEVFGGILTMRGFAHFADLAKHSQTNEAYQRKPYSEHQAEIEKFYRNKHDLFFPELVFAMPLDQILLDGSKYQFSSGEPGVKVTITGTRTASTLERINLILPDLPDGKRLLQRIDGNHRLRAYENLNDMAFDRYLIPFCIVLLRKDQALTTEKALFFNINSKARPLTSEEIYRSIIEDEEGFPVLRPAIFKVIRPSLFEVSQWILSRAFTGITHTEDSARQPAGLQAKFFLR